MKLFLVHLSPDEANTKIILVYLDTHRTIEGIYGLENLNFLCFGKILELPENWYVSSTYPPQ